MKRACGKRKFAACSASWPKNAKDFVGNKKGVMKRDFGKREFAGDSASWPKNAKDFVGN